MIATVGELISYLEGYPESAPLSGAIQPSYPLEAPVNDVREGSDGTVYIVMGNETGYADSSLFKENGY